jgi:hypothetical protein
MVKKRGTNNVYAMKTLEKAVVAKRNLMIKTQGKYYFVTDFFVVAERHILANIESPFIVKLHYAF